MTSLKVLDTLVQGSPKKWNFDSIARDGDEAHAIMIIEGQPFLITVEPLEEDND